MLPRASRLTARRDFDAAYRRGRALRGRILTLRVVVRPSGPSRFGFVVGTRVSKRATVRNRIKRQLRHLVRDRLSGVPAHLDVVITYHGGADSTPETLTTAITNALHALPK